MENFQQMQNLINEKTRALTRARILLDNPEVTEEEIEMALHGE